MESKEQKVSVRREEIRQILDLKSGVDYREELIGYIRKYLKLGWVPVALDARDGTELPIDFSQKSEIWQRQLRDLNLKIPKPNIGLRTGARSHLMVLEVTKGAGESLFDRYGPWRSECVTALGSRRERHFYAWHQSSPFESIAVWKTPGFQVYGEGQIVLAPPSVDAETSEPWRWLSPLQKECPDYPSQSLQQFLEELLNQEPDEVPAVNLSWQEIYCLASPFEGLLEALLASKPTMEAYYRDILGEAWEAGIEEPDVLLSLLWHAPYGDARQNPQRWDDLKNLVKETQDHPETIPSRVQLPFELRSNNGIHIFKEPPGYRGAPATDNPGPLCFLKRYLLKAPQPGPSPRQSFSSREAKRNPRKTNRSRKK
jgi:hypothetical protein